MESTVSLEERNGIGETKMRGTSMPHERKVLGEITNTKNNSNKAQNEALKRNFPSTSKRKGIVSTVRLRSGVKRIEIRQKVQNIPIPQRCIDLNQEIKEQEDEGRDILIDVTDYSFDVHNYMLHLEKQHFVKLGQLHGQLITPRNRVVLVDWLVRVADHFGLTPETLQLTVSIIDRYMSARSDIKRSNFQLLGITALFLAMKYEEVNYAELEDLVHISDDQFRGKDILEMEIKVLKALDFRLGTPVPINFLRRYSKVAEINTHLHNCSKYLIELALHRYELCSYESSKIAAAATFITLCISQREINELLWTENLMSYSSYSLEDLKPVVRLIADTAASANSQTTPNVLQKYARANYYSVSAQISKYVELLKDLSSIK